MTVSAFSFNYINTFVHIVRRGDTSLLAEYLGKHSKTREDIKTWFEAIELDDYASFGGKA
jgi:hypothetical protein